jgi:outer membrane protein assembly factor BamD (BamD/ComL family)
MVQFCAAALLLTPLAAQTSEETAARQLLESGRAAAAAGRSADAMAAFETIVAKYQAVSIADEALLERARVQLDQLRDEKGAAATLDQLFANFAASNSVPAAQVLRARLGLADSASAEQRKTAIAALDRLAAEYAGTDVAAEALYRAAEGIEASGNGDALARFQDLAARYPGRPIVADALMRAAALHAAAGDALDAMTALQRVRSEYPKSPVAARALNQLTILHRLYLRAPAAAPFGYSRSIGGSAGKFRDFRDLLVDRENHLFVATRNQVIELGTTGEVVATHDAQDTNAAFLDGQDRLFTIHDRGVIRGEGRSPLALATARSNGRVEPIDIDAAVALSTGDLIVANRSQKTLVRFSGDGRPKGEMAKGIGARRLAASQQDSLAALDADQKTVTLLARDGRVTGRVAERGASYQLRQPVDVALDALGHLYVLERSAVYVFTPRGDRLLATFSSPERSAGGLSEAQGMAIDAAGRLFIYEGRTDVVQVYQ